MKALVVRKIADFFYCVSENSEYEAKPRGSFKKDNQDIIVGDYVDINILDEENKKAVIEKVHPRKNMMIRPNVANISQIILLFSVKNPKLNPYLIDNFLVMAQREAIHVIIGFTKTDLDETKSYLEVEKIYKDIGYDTILISSKEKTGIEEVKSKIKGNITVVAGPSGAGKSTLINCLSEKYNQSTSDISYKLQKGKNTTTYASLLEFEKDSYIADTPGFTSLRINDMDPSELKDYFVEFYKSGQRCKYSNKCTHEHEPGCAIKEMVENGEISKSRYNSYLKILEEIKKYKKRKKY